MAAVGQKIYGACCWLAQPVTIPTRWVWNSAAYYLGFQEKIITSAEVTQRIRQEAEIWQKYANTYQESEMWAKVKEHLIGPPIPPNILEMLPQELRPKAYTWKTGDRNEFWGLFVQKQFIGELPKPNPLLIQALLNFEKDEKPPGIAVDLGCGAGAATCELLARGWTVIAVDSSHVALEQLSQYVKNRFKDQPKGSLKLVCIEMETYQFPENVRLIFSHSFPYCDPAKFQQVWQRAHHALEKGGRLVAELFPHQGSLPDEIFRIMGAWFTDIQVAKALLDHQGYHREVCEMDKYWWQWGSRTINLMGQKPVS